MREKWYDDNNEMEWKLKIKIKRRLKMGWVKWKWKMEGNDTNNEKRFNVWYVMKREWKWNK